MYGKYPNPHPKKTSEPNKTFEDFHHMMYGIPKRP